MASHELASREGDRQEPPVKEIQGYKTPCPGVGDTFGIYDEEVLA